MNPGSAYSVVKLLTTHPRELLARVRNGLGRSSPSTLKATSGWRDQLAGLWDADYTAEIDEVRRKIGTSHLYDADPALASTIYSAIRSVKPRAVVETGVARGVSTRFILEALDANGVGHLWSVDLPPGTGDLRFAGEEWASAVTRRDRWTFAHGYSRAVLPRLLRRKIGTVDVFIHDSAHSQPNMLFEYEIAWRYLRPSGVLISDDIHLNAAWETFFNKTAGRSLVCEDDVKDGLFGVAVKQ